MQKRTQTMRDISLLRQLQEEGQLVVAPEFQRNSVWPRAAKAYLIDTILKDRPIPFLYFRRLTSAQSGRSVYEVVDGQQRLRAIFEFLEDAFSLTETKEKARHGKRYSQLSQADKAKILSYDLHIEELSGYSDPDVEDMFVRMNMYVVKLSPQEIRHARFSGKFASFVEGISRWEFWRKNRVFTPHQVRRMRAVEFSAELVILLAEGPQDKKKAVDLYYGHYEKRLPFRGEIEDRLKRYVEWIKKALPKLASTRFRKPVDLYGLFGALEQLTSRGRGLAKINPATAGLALSEFDKECRAPEPVGRVARYLAAASRQTDNIAPRTTRIEVLAEIIRKA